MNNKCYKTFILSLAILSIAQPSFAKRPKWASQPTEKRGKYLYVSCHGVGPDEEVAHRVAINQCRSIAAEQINGTFKIKSLTVETEEAVGYHSEAESNQKVNGLGCTVENQYGEEIDSAYETWLRCRFDTSLAKVVPLIGNEHINKGFMSSKNKQLIVSSIPKCNSLIIRGKMDRMIRCDSNPKTLIIYPDDYEIIFRAKNFAPKHVELNRDSESLETEQLEVYLEKR